MKQIFKSKYGYVPQYGATGFTLVEIILTVAISALVVFVLSTFQRNVLSLNRLVFENTEVQQEARTALRNMSAEIRSASPSEVGSYPISQASSNLFTFYTDADNDGTIERIRYFVSGNILKKGVVKPIGSPFIYDNAQEIVTDVVHGIANGATPEFSYYDDFYDGTTAALPAPLDISVVRLVKITLIVDSDPNKDPAPFSLTTQISMRNLKDNL